MFDANEKKDNKPSKLHFWAGALTEGESVPFSFLSSGTKAAKEGVKGMLAFDLLGAAMIAAECLGPHDEVEQGRTTNF